MKQFALLFYSENKPVLGSDGFLPLDGRLGIDSALNEASDHIERLKGVKPGITMAKLYRGDLRNNRLIKTWTKC